ncbi:MAG: SDR family NAD(P)-dependent oxidoreductase [Parachlamydiaceae bacterium]
MSECVALITGATSGIGKAVAQLLGRKGVHLILSGRNQTALEHLFTALSPKVNVQTIQADLSRSDQLNALIHLIRVQRPDLIINSAGFGLYGHALKYSIDEQLNMFDVNARAVLKITLEAGQALIAAKKKGVILNISSACAFHVMPSMAVYAASKAFITQCSQGLDFEFKRDGIRVLTMCPGMVATDFQSRAGGRFQEQHIGVMSAEFVAEKIWNQIEALKPLSIIDWKYRLMTTFSALIPTRWRAAIVERVISKRINPRTLIKSHK